MVRRECRSLFCSDKGGLEYPGNHDSDVFVGRGSLYSKETLWYWSHCLVMSVTQKCEHSYFNSWQSEASFNHLKWILMKTKNFISNTGIGSWFMLKSLIALYNIFGSHCRYKTLLRKTFIWSCLESPNYFGLSFHSLSIILCILKNKVLLWSIPPSATAVHWTCISSESIWKQGQSELTGTEGCFCPPFSQNPLGQEPWASPVLVSLKVLPQYHVINYILYIYNTEVAPWG